jgi:acetyl esterase/lipase
MASARLIAQLALTRGRAHRYGPHRSQRAELHLPAGGGPHRVVVLVHGGSWRTRYSLVVMRALARDLVRGGFAAWNIEYRRLGEGGGWPQTFADVAAAVDELAALDAPLDLTRVSVVGHSAGGHLALWAAGRERLDARQGAQLGGLPRVRFAEVIAMASVSDLAGAYERFHGGSVRELMGGSPEQVPERYALGDPVALVPLRAPVLLVHGISDETVSIELSRSYARAARRAGGEVELVELEGAAGRHRAAIDPRSAAWRTASGWLARRSRVQAPWA